MRGLLGPFVQPSFHYLLIPLFVSLLLSGTVITETIFARPGLGRLLIDSILEGDFPIAQGIVAVVAIFYTLSHIIAELLSLAIDPRLRRGAG